MVSKNTIPTLFVAAILYILCTRYLCIFKVHQVHPKNCITSPSREKRTDSENPLRHLPMHHLQLSKPHDMMPFCGNFEPNSSRPTNPGGLPSEITLEIFHQLGQQRKKTSKISGCLGLLQSHPQPTGTNPRSLYKELRIPNQGRNPGDQWAPSPGWVFPLGIPCKNPMENGPKSEMDGKWGWKSHIYISRVILPNLEWKLLISLEEAHGTLAHDAPPYLTIRRRTPSTFSF